MKKTPLLNIALSRLVASLGHGDIVVIADAGLPVPKGVELIDLALTQGVPDVASTLRTLLSEMQVQNHVLAHELLLTLSPALLCIDLHHGRGDLGGGSCLLTRNSKSCVSKQKRLFVRASASRTAILR